MKLGDTSEEDISHIQQLMRKVKIMNLRKKTLVFAVMVLLLSSLSATSVLATCECGPGTGTPGYWKNHPEAWELDPVDVGGEEVTKTDAIAYMKTPEKGNKCLTLFRALVAAKLNVKAGAASFCIYKDDDPSTMVLANIWLDDLCVDDGKLTGTVRARSAEWKVGEPLYKLLDKYNNGYLCAPSRDSLE